MLRLKQLWRDVRGISAVEFALIAPLMITLLLGSVELSDVMIADRKATSVASTTADLVAQAIQIDNSEITDIFTAATAIMNPYDASGVEVRITSVNIETSTTEVGWSDAYNTTPYAPGSSFTLPTGLGLPGGSVVVGEVKYTHNSVIGQFLGGPKEITDTFYMQPRRTLRVLRVTS